MPALGPVIGELVDSATRTPVAANPRALRGQQHLELVRKVDESIRLKASRTLNHALDASRVLRPDEDETEIGSARPEGWTKQHFRIALDARLPDKDAPAYLRAALRITESFTRSEALQDRKPSPTLNCDIKIVMNREATYNYGRIPDKGE